jgi:hypothetical protein
MGITHLMIYTGYFAKIKIYAEWGLKLISIANTSPPFEEWGITEFKDLAPGKWIYPWKNDLKNRSDLEKAKLEYIEIYSAKCLNNYTPKRLFNDLNAFTGESNAILLCYEKPPVQTGIDGIVDLEWLTAGSTFCHRHLISDFLRRGGYDCCELLLRKERFLNENQKVY